MTPTGVPGGCFALVFNFQFRRDIPVDGAAHGDVAGQATDDVGDRLCQEDAVHAEAKPGQNPTAGRQGPPRM